MMNGSDESMMSSGGSLTNVEVDNAMFMNSQKKNGSWDTMTSGHKRKAGRFDPVRPKEEMKRLGISERYKKFHKITSSSNDSKLNTIPCKRLECEGVLINIGPTPKRAYTKLKRAAERAKELTNGKILDFTHSCCFTCSICADKPTPKHSWQRWCALCDAVYSNNGFFSHHGGNQGRGGRERPLEKRIMQHKQALWDLYVVALKSRKQGAIELCETMETEQKWLIASFAFPHNDMRSGIGSMNTKWVNEYFREAQSRFPVPPSYGECGGSEEKPRFSTGRNFISQGDAVRIREIVREQREKIMNGGDARMSVGKPGSSMMSEDQLAVELEGVFSSMSAMSVDSRAMSVDTRPLSTFTASSNSNRSNRPLSIDSNARPISLEGESLLGPVSRTAFRAQNMRTSSSLMPLSGDLFEDGRTAGYSEKTEDDFYPLRSNTTNEGMQFNTE